MLVSPAVQVLEDVWVDQQNNNISNNPNLYFINGPKHNSYGRLPKVFDLRFLRSEGLARKVVPRSNHDDSQHNNTEAIRGERSDKGSNER